MSRTPFQVYTAVEEFVASQVALLPDMADPIRNAQTTHLIDVWSMDGVDFTNANLIVAALRHDFCPFNGDSAQRLTRGLCHIVGATGAGTPTTSAHSQVHSSFHNYDPLWLWNLQKSDQAMATKITHTVRFSHEVLGLVSPNEATKRATIALMIAAIGG